jgi:aminoglycoside phosphotransferase (APT) family kinase protein
MDAAPDAATRVTATADPVDGPDVEGIDRGPVTDWLAAHVTGSVPPYSFELIAGGRSNLTYRVTDAAGHAYALRRPPVSHVLATAHDMAREHTVISALQATDVPVPTTLGLCTDTAVNGAPFYVMSFVEGHILRDEAASARLPEAVRAHASDSLVDTLARLHAVDVDAVGLGDFARREGYIARQLKRWHGQFEQSTLDGVPGPAVIDRAWEVLSAKIPEQQGVAIVHGDYRLDNTVLDDHGDVIAILDWEICTLGDPLADLGLLLVYWAEADDPDPAVLGSAPTALPGFASRAELVGRYAAASGRDVSAVPYYRAFGIWKLACILQGVYVRYAGGAAAGDRSGVDQFADGVARLGERALADVEAL